MNVRDGGSTPDAAAAPTPGPWTHYDDSDSRFARAHRHQIAALGKTIAHIYCTNGQEDEDYANARLIAAAPETAAERDRLVEALKNIAQIQQDKCENASAEMLFMLLNNKVGIALAALAYRKKD